jgi:hypothetical protein
MNQSTNAATMVAVAISILSLSTSCQTAPAPQPVDRATGAGTLFQLPSCDAEGICGRTLSCSTGCTREDPEDGPIAQTCREATGGECGQAEDPDDPGRPPPPPGGTGGSGEPFFCSTPGPRQATFWEHAGFRGRCVTVTMPRGSTEWRVGFIEDAGANIFFNDTLSSIAVGSGATLEGFEHANFGHSFGVWWGPISVDYVGDVANDRISSFIMRAR